MDHTDDKMSATISNKQYFCLIVILLSLFSFYVKRIVSYLQQQMQVHRCESGNINILKKICPLLNLLSQELIAKLYMIQICGKSLNGVLIMTTDLMMYGLGNNENGQLGIDRVDKVSYPEKIEVLCGKKIKKLVYLDNPVVFALTEEGKIYSWGFNKNGILGLGSKASSVVHRPALISNLKEECIVDIASDGNHAVALTNHGKIYSWGKLYYKGMHGDNCNIDSYKFHREYIPKIFWNNEFGSIKHICCGKDFTIVLTEKGVYGSGINDKYQLGILYKEELKYLTPTFIQLFSGKIVKIVCGHSHVLALDNERKLYVWGSNEYGQLGIELSTKMAQCRVFDEHKRNIVNIAALSHRNLSVALDDEGCVYVWGSCKDVHLNTPIKIESSDMYEIFGWDLPYTFWASTLKSDNENDKDIDKDTDNYKDKVSDIFQNTETMFDDSSLSDLMIQVGNQLIHVHKAILNIRSEYFRNIFQQTKWKKSNLSDDKFKFDDKFPYDVVKSFLKYLYTDKIDLPADKTIELCNLAKEYNETELMKRGILILMENGTCTVCNDGIKIQYESKC